MVHTITHERRLQMTQAVVGLMPVPTPTGEARLVTYASPAPCPTVERVFVPTTHSLRRVTEVVFALAMWPSLFSS